VDSQSVYATSEFFGQHIMNSSVTGKTLHPIEVLGHQHDLEMGFGTRRHIVSAAFVADIEMLQIEVTKEFVIDDGL
jgi:hypothetical protein